MQKPRVFPGVFAAPLSPIATASVSCYLVAEELYCDFKEMEANHGVRMKRYPPLHPEDGRKHSFTEIGCPLCSLGLKSTSPLFYTFVDCQVTTFISARARISLQEVSDLLRMRTPKAAKKSLGGYDFGIEAGSFPAFFNLL